jgi:hypothetical protein
MNSLFKNLTQIELIQSTITCIQFGIGLNTEKPYKLVRDYGVFNVTETNRHFVAKNMCNALVKLNTMMYEKFGIDDYVGSHFSNWEPIINSTTEKGYIKRDPN